MLVAAFSVGSVASAGAPSQASVTAWAMRWFKEMQAGRTDRSQYAAPYRAQVTDDPVKSMSHPLDEYGVSPLRAKIVQTRKIGEQTFYVVKFVFPRSDATTMLLP